VTVANERDLLRGGGHFSVCFFSQLMFRRAKNRQEASALSLSLSFVLSARVCVFVCVFKGFFFVWFFLQKKKERDFFIVREKSPDGQRRAMKNALLLDCSLKVNNNNNNINLLLQRVNVLLHFSLHSRALSVSLSLVRAVRSLFLSPLSKKSPNHVSSS
jgi:hypothetical protein